MTQKDLRGETHDGDSVFICRATAAGLLLRAVSFSIHMGGETFMTGTVRLAGYTAEWEEYRKRNVLIFNDKHLNIYI